MGREDAGCVTAFLKWLRADLRVMAVKPTKDVHVALGVGPNASGDRNVQVKFPIHVNEVGILVQEELYLPEP